MINALLRRLGYQIIASAGRQDSRNGAPAPLPAGAEARLRPDHPRLLELERAYAQCDARVTASPLWKRQHLSPYDLRYFRGDNAYVWQIRDGGMTVPSRDALDREREPAWGDEGLGALVEEPGADERVGDEPAQILGGPRLHARRNFL